MSKKRLMVSIFMILSVTASVSNGNGLPEMIRVKPPAEPAALPLRPEHVAGKNKEIWYKAGGTYIVRNVTQATLTPVLPAPGKATGAAVIVAPGGAYMILPVEHEGWQIAKKLAENGITAFVLKYRISKTPVDEKEFAAYARSRGQLIAKSLSDGTPMPEEPRATEDALAAVKMVRENAGKWHIDPSRVGVMGFSAGAVTAIKVAVSSDASARPDFIASFYPSLASESVPHDAPPMFLAIAFDDPLFGKQQMDIVEAWRKAGRKVEFHGYESGGHGFGFGMPETTTSLVFEQFMLWMRFNGYLKQTHENDKLR
ncbi:hypothetical protein AC790_18470 [Pantoea sp. RIT-PI-b]|uniref:alpha/beta hydrolase n=1 Tax=Pantoea sp. RIT-PI-b TaxID=1681195 RepID=UPI0006763669|nr:alpha/beta hydrolase [Pantoea sp. RIT-PI-b]KNC07545.1 hypothetical protein AC790_18470 [Pantoea sp. RIT-PI-b]